MLWVVIILYSVYLQTNQNVDGKAGPFKNRQKRSNTIILFLFQQWTDELLKLAYNLTQLNGSTTMFLQKAHTKLCLQVDKTGKIPVKK